MVGMIAVTIVELLMVVSCYLSIIVAYIGYSRRSGPESEENACQQQIWIHTPRLYKNHERKAYNHVAAHDNDAKTNAVAQKAPYWTGDEHEELIGKAQSADCVANLHLLADAVGDDERDGGIEEDQKGDAEKADADEVSRSLRTRSSEWEHEAQHVASCAHHVVD